jgi:hypothetical protein
MPPHPADLYFLILCVVVVVFLCALILEIPKSVTGKIRALRKKPVEDRLTTLINEAVERGKRFQEESELPPPDGATASIGIGPDMSGATGATGPIGPTGISGVSGPTFTGADVRDDRGHIIGSVVSDSTITLSSPPEAGTPIYIDYSSDQDAEAFLKETLQRKAEPEEPPKPLPPKTLYDHLKEDEDL